MEIRVSGSSTTLEKVKGNTQVALLVLGTVREVGDVWTSNSGKKEVAKVRMDSVIVATGEEAEELQERLAAVREEIEETKRGATVNLADSLDDEYSGQSHADLRALCKVRGINAKGSKLELAQRLRDVG